MENQLDELGWQLVSAEQQRDSYPATFEIPDFEIRNNLSPGMGAKLLFDIETKANGVVIDRGVDRMWVIVLPESTSQLGRYQGILDSDPGIAENLQLRKGDIITFGPEHICEINQPPREFLLEVHGFYFEGLV
jgi:hypothetical protein